MLASEKPAPKGTTPNLAHHAESKMQFHEFRSFWDIRKKTAPRHVKRQEACRFQIKSVKNMNTSKITTLCPETAKMLLSNFSDAFLHLNGLTTLDADTAKVIAEFNGHGLVLNGLTTLSTDATTALAECKSQHLSLDGLTTLDADAAKALAEFKGHWLHLNGLTTLDADTAKALSEFKAQSLILDGLTTVNADTAKALAGFNGTLYVCEEVDQLIKNPKNPPTLTLTDAEREAIEYFSKWGAWVDAAGSHSKAMAGLLERTK